MGKSCAWSIYGVFFYLLLQGFTQKEAVYVVLWFRVIFHGNGRPGQKVIGLAEEVAGGCLLILW